MSSIKPTSSPLPNLSIIAIKLRRYLEPPLFSILRNTPFKPQKFIFEQLLKILFKEPIAEGELEFLTDKTVQISITGLGIDWQLSFIDDQITVLSPTNHRPADATISGTVNAFVLLASRQEDPDTLFFQRKLSIEGNTELGLEVKNLLDSVEIDLLPNTFQHILKKAGKFSAA